MCGGGRQARAGSWEQRTKEPCLRSLTRLRRPGWHESKPPAVSVCSGGAAATYPSGCRVICALRCLPLSLVRTCGLVGPLLDWGCCPVSPCFSAGLRVGWDRLWPGSPQPYYSCAVLFSLLTLPLELLWAPHWNRSSSQQGTINFPPSSCLPLPLLEELEPSRRGRESWAIAQPVRGHQQHNSSCAGTRWMEQHLHPCWGWPCVSSPFSVENQGAWTCCLSVWSCCVYRRRFGLPAPLWASGAKDAGGLPADGGITCCAGSNILPLGVELSKASWRAAGAQPPLSRVGRWARRLPFLHSSRRMLERGRRLLNSPFCPLTAHEMSLLHAQLLGLAGM